MWSYKAYIGLYTLDTLSRTVDPIQLGFYHNDRLLHIPNSDGPKCPRRQKKDYKSL